VSDILVIPGGFVPAHAAALRLTQRELELLQAIANGIRLRPLAGLWGISYDTIRTHRQNILAKLGVHSITRAVVVARDIGAIR
jgi:two-component system, NarL family, response regulator DevR